MGQQPEEGWYSDPYGRHEARWLSDGKPTKLVRDGDVETYDAPPDGPPVQVPVALDAKGDGVDSDDLRRADSAQEGDAYDPKKARRQVLDIFDQIGFLGDR